MSGEVCVKEIKFLKVRVLTHLSLIIVKERLAKSIQTLGDPKNIKTIITKITNKTSKIISRVNQEQKANRKRLHLQLNFHFHNYLPSTSDKIMFFFVKIVYIGIANGTISHLKYLTYLIYFKLSVWSLITIRDSIQNGWRIRRTIDIRMDHSRQTATTQFAWFIVVFVGFAGLTMFKAKECGITTQKTILGCLRLFIFQT